MPVSDFRALGDGHHPRRRVCLGTLYLSLRDYLRAADTGGKEGSTWTDLWTIGASSDFRVAEMSVAGGEPAIVRILHTDDTAEIGIRRISACIYTQRTGDYSGGTHMLGTVPPSPGNNIAPVWLVAESTQHSKSEHQRAEWVAASFRERKRDGG